MLTVVVNFYKCLISNIVRVLLWLIFWTEKQNFHTHVFIYKHTNLHKTKSHKYKLQKTELPKLAQLSVTGLGIWCAREEGWEGWLEPGLLG